MTSFGKSCVNYFFGTFFVGTMSSLLCSDMFYSHMKNKQYHFMIPYEIFYSRAKTVLVKHTAVDDRKDIQNSYHNYLITKKNEKKNKET